MVTLGDSLTQGFQSGAIRLTAWSWPAMVARQLGWNDFRFPTYEGYGGIPFNVELCLRHLENEFGAVSFWDSVPATLWLLHYAHQVEHWWAEDADQAWHPPPGLNHNLAVYSYDIADSWLRTKSLIDRSIVPPSHKWLRLKIPHDVDRAARRVLVHADADMAALDVAAAHGRDGGIETLVVALGANNVLDVVIGMDLIWGTGEKDRGKATVWSPGFFASDWAELVRRLRQIDARHVIVATVPHVTIVPLFSGVGDRVRPDSRYFPYYAHVWFADRFDPGRHKYLTGDQARTIDSAIDQYNETIMDSVAAARAEGLDWYVFELGGLLDRLASRRYLMNPAARPSWWEEVGGAYPLPEPLASLDPVPDTRFFMSDASGRGQGGLFALDGVHPTTVGYGIAAQEVIRIMELAGVAFPSPQGASMTAPSNIDFAALLAADRLMSDPPKSLTADLHALAWISDKVDLIAKLLHHPAPV
jgi:hypothetical protein